MEEGALREFDEEIRRQLGFTCRGSIHDEGFLQVTLGVHEGGLGLRRASDLALPAFIASSVQARPAIAALLGEGHSCLPLDLPSALDMGTQEAIDQLKISSKQ